MALKAVHVSDVPNLDHVPESVALSASLYMPGIESVRMNYKPPMFMVIGHRGSGMNMLQSPDKRMKAIKENTILSFNNAAKADLNFVEFDVQVTNDDCPVIFHDNFILTEENGSLCEKRFTDLTLSEFLGYGPQRDAAIEGKSLLRKTKDGRIHSWNVEEDDTFCTLQEAFLKVDPTLGFNIELKFDDNINYQEHDLIHTLQVILQVVFEYSNERPIILSSFQPDAALLVRKLQSTYPVFFLSNGGSEVYSDVRRNSLEEAIKLCLAGGLQGVVSEVKAIFRNPGFISKIKEANLSLLTYGQLNNVPEAVYMQNLMGVDGVIVDLVREISQAVSSFNKSTEEEDTAVAGIDERDSWVTSKPKFSAKELSFLFKLIPELIQV
ncbi:hypothetical protein AMTRI_Chr06g192090 [Amborella trichopoda]